MVIIMWKTAEKTGRAPGRWPRPRSSTPRTPADVRHRRIPDTDWKRHYHSNGTWKWPVDTPAVDETP